MLIDAFCVGFDACVCLWVAAMFGFVVLLVMLLTLFGWVAGVLVFVCLKLVVLADLDGCGFGYWFGVGIVVWWGVALCSCKVCGWYGLYWYLFRCYLVFVCCLLISAYC